MRKIDLLRSVVLTAAVCGVLFSASTTGRGQKGGVTQGPVNAGQQSPGLPPLMPEDPATQQHNRSLESEQTRLRNSDRQKRLISDTEKLLELASELKVDVDKTDKNVLSMDVIRKADEIEKLAHSVKERMKS